MSLLLLALQLLARNGLGLFATALATGNSAGEHFIPSSKATPAPSATSTLQSAAALQRHALQVTPAAEVPLPYGLQDKPHPKGYVAYRTSGTRCIHKCMYTFKSVCMDRSAQICNTLFNAATAVSYGKDMQANKHPHLAALQLPTYSH